MALRKSIQVGKRVPAPSPLDASNPVVVYGEHTIVAGQFALTDVIELIPFPAGTVPVMVKAMVADLDSNGSPLVTLDFGILTGQYGAELDDAGSARDCASTFVAASTVGQAGGAIDVAANLLLGIAPNNKDRSIGFKVAAAAATLTAGAKIRVAAIFAPAPQGLAITTT